MKLYKKGSNDMNLFYSQFVLKGLKTLFTRYPTCLRSMNIKTIKSCTKEMLLYKDI